VNSSTLDFSDVHPTKEGEEQAAEELSFAAARMRKRELLAELCLNETADPPSPEDLLARWPTDPKRDSDVASLLFADFQQRSLRGEEPSIAEYDRRFPEHKDSIASLFRHQDFLRSMKGGSGSSVPRLALPSVGDKLFGFHLRHELGSGAFARVYLAEQSDLAGRPVVLKVSDTDGNEPQTMAQLQHTHIVPIYSVHEDTRAGLRAVCMPYFGGASLSRVLQSLWNQEQPPQRGEQLLQSLAAVGGPVVARPASEAGPVTVLADLDYVRASAWLVARLAEGLQHAHERGIYHRDIKPSNILLGGDGQPMLLDFNLAHNIHSDQAKAAATLGGTVSYMSPEHLRALTSRDPNLVRQVDQRSDVYSLGMVLYEMLTGHNPFDQSGSYSPLPVLMEAMAVERSKNVPSLRQRRPDTPWGLESIARKCMAPDQGQRYQQAAHVAEDLHRFLSDLPLKYAPELSRVERLRKWIRRHPRLTSSSSVAAAAAVLLLALGASLIGVRQHLVSAQEQLTSSQARERKAMFDDGTVQALCLVNTSTDVTDHVVQGVQVCRNTLALYGILDRNDWQNHPHWQRLQADERQQIAEDARELLLLLAWARVRTAPGEQKALQEALALLDRAEVIVGLQPSAALWRDRATYLTLLGDTEAAHAARTTAEQIAPNSPRDHYLLATTYIHGGGADRYLKALDELKQAIGLNPKHYWSHTQKGICHLELGEYVLAAAEFAECVGLWPDFAWSYFNRGFALYQSGRKAEALDDYSAALRRDPEFLEAYVNRGLVHLELGKHAGALADFQKAIERGRHSAGIHASMGIALEGLHRPQEADAAFRKAFEAIRSAPPAEANRIRWTYGFAVASRLPSEARRAFDEVLENEPNHPEALYGRGLLLVNEKRPKEALPFYNRALEIAPQFLEARLGRAVLLAREGDFDGAVRDINACLERDPKSGAVLYRAACVLALAAKKETDATRAKRLADDALSRLRSAFAAGHSRSGAAEDSDLDAIRELPEFQQILSEGR
jgi:serine/threonine protein kinase/tetratricopeptide (TPR) repeat protein